jgi:hypothetical protein
MDLCPELAHKIQAEMVPHFFFTRFPISIAAGQRDATKHTQSESVSVYANKKKPTEIDIFGFFVQKNSSQEDE